MKHRIPFLRRRRPTVGVIRLAGVIASGSRGHLNDARLAPLIEKAFTKGKPDAVALVLNSPGGSPVQSSLIAARIRRLAEDRNIPVHAFVEDVAASGGYWLACAADDIWVDENSILGSIGVISSGFGLDDFISRHGISRRVHTAGDAKSMLDPFQPEKPGDVKRLKTALEHIHENFKSHVSARRAHRLNGDDTTFTGEFWVGRRAIEQGLADGVGHLTPKMKELYGDKTRFRVYGPKRGLFQRLGARVLSDALLELKERAEFARFGL